LNINKLNLYKFINKKMGDDISFEVCLHIYK